MKGRSRILLLLLLVFIGVFPFPTAGFPLGVKGIDTLNTAILIRDLRFGRDLVAENIDRSLIPASIMKSVTVASMLNVAGTDEYFTTPVIAEGRIKDGVLYGNVVVKTCGDPTIESQYFSANKGFADSIAAGLKRAGISEVKGRLIIDESMFKDAITPPGWMAEDIVWPYGAILRGANFRDNRFRLRLPSRETDPFVPDLEFKTIASKRRGVKVDRKDGSETFVVTGRNKRGFSDNFATPFPAKVMQHEILSTIEKSGVIVENQSVVPDRNISCVIYEHISPAFGDIMKSLMYRSDNLMAEGILRALTPGSSRQDALNEVRKIWMLAGISGHGVNIVDGSGLSRDNRLTARYLADIYQHMLTLAGEEYTSLFPRAGYDGTMRNFLVNTELEKRVAMKTGSMRGVQSYAGYLFDEEGHPTHILVFIVNNFNCSRAALKSDIQRLLLEKFGVSLHSDSSASTENDSESDEDNSETVENQDEQ